MSSQQKVCFGTLALGENYRRLASVLAQDISKYSPSTPLIVLTDRPNYFTQSNVLAFKHDQQSVGCYHDKRFVLKKGLSLYNSCIFIDADMRLLAPISTEIKWLPGITAHTVWHNIPKHHKNKSNLQLMQRMADKLGLDLTQISFVHECLFVLTKDNGKEQIFLDYWDKIAPFFELNRYYRDEGLTIGMAAAIADLEIRQDLSRSINFFKDKLEQSELKKGQALSPKILEFIKQQKQLEYPQQSLPRRAFKKAQKLLTRGRCLSTLHLKALTDYKFYHS